MPLTGQGSLFRLNAGDGDLRGSGVEEFLLAKVFDLHAVASFGRSSGLFLGQHTVVVSVLCPCHPSVGGR